MADSNVRSLLATIMSAEVSSSVEKLLLSGSESLFVCGLHVFNHDISELKICLLPDDFVTANVTSGTGGIDASIGFETLRPENSGSAMNDSLSFFAPYVNKHVSSELFFYFRNL